MGRALERVEGIAVPLLWDNVDTDALTPAAPHKAIGGGTDRLREILFYEFRFDATGKPKPDFVLNDPRYTGAPILIAGDNFGCGSSREVAVWSLTDFGFKAVIARSFAEIFEQNAYKNRLIPASVDSATHARIAAMLGTSPLSKVTIDLAELCVYVDGESAGSFSVDDLGREMILTGSDEFSLTQNYVADIAATQRRLTGQYPWLGL